VQHALERAAEGAVSLPSVRVRPVGPYHSAAAAALAFPAPRVSCSKPRPWFPAAPVHRLVATVDDAVWMPSFTYGVDWATEQALGVGSFSVKSSVGAFTRGDGARQARIPER